MRLRCFKVGPRQLREADGTKGKFIRSSGSVFPINFGWVMTTAGALGKRGLKPKRGKFHPRPKDPLLRKGTKMHPAERIFVKAISQ